MKILLRIDRYLAACECLLAVCLFVALMGVLTVNILLRNLAGTSLPGTFDIAATLVLWLALVGGSLALRDRRHIKIEFLLRFVPAAWHHRADLAVSLFGVAVMGGLLVTAVLFTQNEIAIFGRSGWATVIFPLFFTLATFRFTLQAYGALSPRYSYRPEWPALFTLKTPPAP
jgi:TRAP-type C4-dicarboxylate transport system permease small subunit